MLLHFAANNDYAYLNSSLQHIIHIRSPQGIHPPAGKVLRLLKALYGPKQSGRGWYGTLTQALLDMGFKHAFFGPCVFHTDGLVVTVYVDDLLFIGHTQQVSFKTSVAGRFKAKDLRTAKYLLGMEVIANCEFIMITPQAYAN